MVISSGSLTLISAASLVNQVQCPLLSCLPAAQYSNSKFHGSPPCDLISVPSHQQITNLKHHKQKRKNLFFSFLMLCAAMVIPVLSQQSGNISGQDLRRSSRAVAPSKARQGSEDAETAAAAAVRETATAWRRGADLKRWEGTVLSADIYIRAPLGPVSTTNRC